MKGRRKSEHSAHLTWALAVEIAGSEARLTAGVHHRTWGWWRARDAVPAYRVLPFLLERYMDGRKPGALAKRRATGS